MRRRRVSSACFADDLAKTLAVDLATWRTRRRRYRIAEGAGRFVSPLL